MSSSRTGFLRRVRIHGGESGAVARALHHEVGLKISPAVKKNVFFTTKERKSMSTKTNFKRLALVVVSALGLGMLSVAPSSATVSDVAISTPTAGAATYLAGATSGAVMNDTTTAASFTVTALLTTLTDTVTVRIYENTKPATSTNADKVRFSVRETTTANTFVVTAGTTANGGLVPATFNKFNSTNFGVGGDAAGLADRHDSVTVGSGYDIMAGGVNSALTRGSAVGRVGATFNAYLESATSYVAGTYTYDIVVTAYSNTGSAWSTTVTTTTVSIVVAASAATVTANSKTPTATGATQWMSTTQALAEAASSDVVISTEATASTTPKAWISTRLKNADGTTTIAEDSLTATITGPGLICDGSVCGKTLSSVALDSGLKSLSVRSDGTAGTATISIQSTVVTFPAKSITFYAKAAKTITATVRHPVLGVGANTGAIGVTAVDANSIAWTGTAYIYAVDAASALIAGSETPAACTAWNSTNGIRCDLTGKLPGTAKFKIIDAATVATATASSDEFSVTVSAGTAGSVSLAFDKATYAPFERARITVTVLDTAGKRLPAQTISDVFAAGGISSTVAFGSSSDTLTATNVVLSATSSSTTGATAGAQVYTVYMPGNGGDVTISATGSTGLPLAARVAISATAKVVSPAETAANAATTTAAAAQASADAATDAALEAIDAANAATDAANLAAEAADAATVAAEEARDAADAATAAVEALATEVATLMAALKAQITTLARTVAKIAKKVNA